MCQIVSVHCCHNPHLQTWSPGVFWLHIVLQALGVRPETAGHLECGRQWWWVIDSDSSSNTGTVSFILMVQCRHLLSCIWMCLVQTCVHDFQFARGTGKMMFDSLTFQRQVDRWAGIAGRCKLVWRLGAVTHLQRHLHSWVWSRAQQTRMEAYQQQYHIMIHCSMYNPLHSDPILPGVAVQSMLKLVN